MFKVAVLETGIRFESATGQKRVPDADRSGTTEGYFYIEVIILVQKTAWNRVQDLLLMVCPILPCEPFGGFSQSFHHVCFFGLPEFLIESR